MPASGNPARGRRLAAELRRLRTRSGKTADEVGRALGWSKAKISRYELAQGGIKPVDVDKLLDFYGVGGSHRGQLLALAQEATRKGWWEAYSDVLTDEHAEFIGLEADATSVLQWQADVVPGLLQTRQYAWHVFAGRRDVAIIPPTVIDRRVETRLIRQQRLAGDQPLELSVVLDESVLQRRFGDRSVMYAQLQQLAKMSEPPNVTLRILPLAEDHRLAVSSFVILRFGREHETTLHDVVNTEHLTTELYVEDETDTYEFRLAFQHLAEGSLSPADSRALILQTAQQMWA
jgi:transcriptional regulator with XRE-family HTH domain